ncbi:hypothetical protein GCM10009640_15130 [Agrococcus citreus]|uniref:Uncharacterized protein n=1 Tax=Agrococcus citreus TaxID=84643 RepID=A0ABP4JM69_9MICO
MPIARAEPAHHHAVRPHRHVDELRQPRPGGDDDAPRAHVAPLEPHRDGRVARIADVVDLDREHPLARADLGARRARRVDGRDDRGLGPQHARLGIPQAHVAGIEPSQRGQPLGDRRGVEPLDGEVVLSCRREGALDDAGAGLPDHDAAGLEQQLLAAQRLELAPQRAGAAGDGREAGVLEARDAEEPRAAVRSAPCVPRLVLIDGDDVEPARREPPRRARPDRAQPDDHDVGDPLAHRIHSHPPPLVLNVAGGHSTRICTRTTTRDVERQRE